MKFTQYFYLVSLFISISFTSCKKDPEEPTGTGSLSLEFENVVGNEPLVLVGETRQGPTYRNANQDAFQVTTFRYYISNLILTKTNGQEFKQPESYYLVDHSQAVSRHITIPNIPTGEYNKITFTIGVDSARNTSGAQTGALDPANEMFWSWNTGYIFLKMEGTSPQSTTNGNLVFHIGGFKKPNNTIRTVSPTLHGEKITIKTSKTPDVHLKVDLLEMFQGPTNIKFSELNTAMGGPKAVTIADNYTAMFKVDHIHY
ncbi:MbnP family protein [Adhaeribacter aquaticus]|uniref:MbnP family protein n=1 Tax=Adhaeribacter aquaticus TaxID=299567 RepID=UPI00040DBF12|nr:MbnP family protein [Adhaeribacter aquaticus]